MSIKMFHIEEISDDGNLDEFIKFPFKLYEKSTNWVAPLYKLEKELFNKNKHPFLKNNKVEFFIVKDKDRNVCGRIAAIENKVFNEKWNEKAVFFGFFECINDTEPAKLLFDEVVEFAKKQSAVVIYGPTNYSVNETAGLLIDGFDKPPAIMMPYNYDYYPALLEKYGFSKAKDLLAYELRRPLKIPERLYYISEKLKKKYTLRNVRPKEIDKEILIIQDIYNDAWNENWGAIPISKEEAEYTAKNLKKFLDPELSFIVEHNNKPIAFSLALPDYNQVLKHLNGKISIFNILKVFMLNKQINNMRLMALGIKSGYRKKGIDALLYLHTMQVGLRKNYQTAELSWILEDNNVLINTLTHLEAKITKRYRIYKLNVT